MNFEHLLQNGEIILSGDVITDAMAEWYEVGGFSAGQVRAALASFGEDDVIIRLNSPGGIAAQGEAIRAVLANHPGHVHLVVEGLAASAASLLMLGAPSREMSTGSFIMIHDPRGITLGDEMEHRRNADVLATMGDGYASVYADAMGITAKAAREIMRAETWYSAEEAVEAGLVQSTSAAASLSFETQRAAKAAFTERLTAMQHRLEVHTLAQTSRAPSHQQEELAIMSTPQNTPAGTGTQPAASLAVGSDVITEAQMSASANAAAEAAVQAERTRASAIRLAAAPFMASGQLSEADVQAEIDAGTTAEAAGGKFLAKLAEAGPVSPTAPNSARITRDEIDTRNAQMTAALTARLGQSVPDEAARAYMDHSLIEMAAVASGQAIPLAGAGFSRREEVLMSAMNTTSDFPAIFTSSINAVLAERHELVGRTFVAISREFTFNDFRDHEIIRADQFPTLQKVSETGEIKHGTITEGKETLNLFAYASAMTISRKMMVNDSLGAIAQVVENAADIIPEFEEGIFWTSFLTNGALADGTAMWHADHGNLAAAGTTITVAAVGAGRAALRKMTAKDGRNLMANAPSILLVGPDKETEAEQFLAAITPTKKDDVNPFPRTLRPVVSEAITGNQWYLLVDPARRTHSFKHGYLEGARQPRARVDEPFGRQGMSFSLEHDFGTGGVNHRGSYKNPGA